MDILKMAREKIMVLLLAFVFGALPLVGSQAIAAAESKLSAASLAGLKSLDGKNVALADKGKTLVYFWASWCPDCRDKLQTKLPEWSTKPGVQVLTVNTDRAVERANHFVQKEGVKVAVARDEEKTLQKALKVFSVPFWAVIERDGDSYRILAAEAGSNVEKLEKALLP